MDSGESGQCESCGKNVYNFRRICVSCAQLTTLIREVAAWRKHHDGGMHHRFGYSEVEATNANPDLQARIAREMESK